jgi:acetylornithine deacetylase/succinyl-diaminopimelate desuccinylase-like protein
MYACWHASDSDRWLALDVHLDTVGVETMEGDPFSGKIASGRVYGRGAVDTKASLAVALALLEDLRRRRQKLPCNFLLAATVDEEHSATGAPALARWIKRRRLQIDEMIVAEPTMCAPVHGHKGVVRMMFHLQGRAAHSSNPSRGRNAITAGAKLVLVMQKEADRLARVRSPLGAPALTVTLINGGSGVNVVPERCCIAVDRRVVPGESAVAISRALARLAKHSVELPLKIESSILIDSFYNPADSPFVQQLAKWSGRAPDVMPFCTNAWAYPKVAKECVVLGPGSIAQAHAAVEWVEILQLKELSAIYAKWWGIEP